MTKAENSGHAVVSPAVATPAVGAERPLSPAAQRALAEAAERRARLDEERAGAAAEAERGGRKGPDPVRYGDWENGGIASDF